jgi:hypothetical protein
MDKNPYVGPRAYAAEDQVGLYGRKREARDILGLLVAERIVLLYSPSGAGKTSLIEAALVPSLAKQRFRVFPRIRVGLELSAPAGVNRYDFSALNSLGEGRSGSDESPSLGRYLHDELARETTARGDVLIFDQFEEILTLSATDREEKQQFFQNLSEILENRRLWALFALREEYLAALEPLFAYLPGKISSKYRLDFLSPEAAVLAIRGPAEERRVRYTEAAIEHLVGDLRLVREMGPNGEPIDTAGPAVEPVHLQVVCHRLWEKVKQDELQRDEEGFSLIDVPQVATAGRVGDALKEHYRDVVAKVAPSPHRERRIRSWIGTQLITSQQFRNQVMRGGRKTAGLEERLIQKLIGAYLVRREERRGLVWYELAHDRLIEPIIEDNACWFEENATELQRLAEFWSTHGHPKRLLLSGDKLDDTTSELGRNPEISALEKEFIDASRRADLEASKKRARMRFRAAALIVLLTIVTGIATSYNVTLRVERVSLQDSAFTLLTERSALYSQARGKEQSLDTILRYVQAAFLSADPREREEAELRLLSIATASEITPQTDSLDLRTLTTAPADSPLVIRYYARPTDVALVEAALRPLGYPLERRPSTGGGSTTNQVLYGRPINVEDARRVALALVAAGVPIKRVAPFEDSIRLVRKEIQVLGSANLKDLQPLTADSIRSLNNLRRWVGPRTLAEVMQNDTGRADVSPPERTEVRPTPGAPDSQRTQRSQDSLTIPNLTTGFRAPPRRP